MFMGCLADSVEPVQVWPPETLAVEISDAGNILAFMLRLSVFFEVRR
jgi:hypothetical protein